jgi:hypothetical protein
LSPNVTRRECVLTATCSETTTNNNDVAGG